MLFRARRGKNYNKCLTLAGCKGLFLFVVNYYLYKPLPPGFVLKIFSFHRPPFAPDPTLNYIHLFKLT
jgi:hypothetical protein